MVPDKQETDIEVEVVYALPTEQVLLHVRVAPHTTVIQAIRASGVLARYPEITLESLQAGIFGKAVSLDAQLNAGERVEIYRPLIVDPKEARRRRNKNKKR